MTWELKFVVGLLVLPFGLFASVGLMELSGRLWGGVLLTECGGRAMCWRVSASAFWPCGFCRKE